MSFKPPWTAERQFDVTGTSSAREALTAVDAANNAISIPKRADTHPETLALVCNGPEVRAKKGTDFWVIACTYGLDDGRIEPTPPGGEEDPLLQPVRYTWEHVEVSEAVDVDLDKRPILNGAGFPLNGAARPITFKRLHVIRNEPTWNLAKSLACENGVNDGPITLASGVTIATEHMRCAMIIPDGEYAIGFRFLPIHYLFEIIFDDSLGAYPFQHRFLNTSTQGWYDDSGTKRSGKFTDGKEEIISEPVRIGPTGIPLPTPFPSVKVGSAAGDQAAVAAPNNINYYKTEYLKGAGQTAGGASDAEANILYYKRSRVVDLSVLGL